MTKKEYLQKVGTWEGIAKLSAQQLARAKENYIASNKMLNEGDHVKVTDHVNHTEVIGIVTGFHLNNLNNVIPYVSKIFEDGTPSHNTHWVYPHCVITKIQQNGKEETKRSSGV